MEKPLLTGNSEDGIHHYYLCQISDSNYIIYDAINNISNIKSRESDFVKEIGIFHNEKDAIAHFHNISGIVNIAGVPPINAK